MFKNIKLSFTLSYFLTAMYPAYAIFLLKQSMLLNRDSLSIFPLEFQEIILNYIANRYIFIAVAQIILLIITLGIGYCIKKKIQNADGQQQNYTVSSAELRDYSTNSGIVPFLLGIILPTIVDVGENAIVGFLLFILLQLLVFVLMCRSDDIFLNAILIIVFNVNILFKDNNYYFYIVKTYMQSPTELNVVSFNGNSNIYILYSKGENK